MNSSGRMLRVAIARREHRQVDHQVDARPQVDLAEFRCRDIGPLVGCHLAGDVDQQVAVVVEEIRNVDDLQQEAAQRDRSRRADLRVASGDDRVAVVAGVAPAPRDRLAADHERRNLVERVVHPVGLERGAMAGFMPTRVGRGGIELAVDGKRDDGPPGAPQRQPRQPERQQQREPEQRVAHRRAIAALQQLAHLLLGDRRGVPLRIRQAPLHRQGRVFTDQAVIAERPVCFNTHGHNVFPLPEPARACVAGSRLC